jgi:hypothetical protein
MLPEMADCFQYSMATGGEYHAAMQILFRVFHINNLKQLKRSCWEKHAVPLMTNEAAMEIIGEAFHYANQRNTENADELEAAIFAGLKVCKGIKNSATDKSQKSCETVRLATPFQRFTIHVRCAEEPVIIGFSKSGS